MRSLMHGDRASVRVNGTDPRGRPLGSLVEVLERAKRRIVGRLHDERGVLVLVPEDRRIAHDILVPPAEGAPRTLHSSLNRSLALRAVSLTYPDPFLKRTVCIEAPRAKFCERYGFSNPSGGPKLPRNLDSREEIAGKHVRAASKPSVP
jgi:hypothetical protein